MSQAVTLTLNKMVSLNLIHEDEQTALPFIKDFTIEAWFRPTGNTGQRPIISRWNQSGASAPYGWHIATNGSNVTFGYGPNSTSVNFLTGGTIQLNTWQHVAVTCSGNTYTLFLNGAVVATATVVLNATSYTYGIPIVLGSIINGSSVLPGGGQTDFAGSIDGVRITDGAARWTSAFTPPSWPAYAG